MKRDPIILHGTVLGRSVARHPIARDGTRMQASHDREVTLTLQFPIPNERPLEFSMRLDSLPRGWMEIGDPVMVTIAAGVVKTEPYSIAPVNAEEEATLP